MSAALTVIEPIPDRLGPRPPHAAEVLHVIRYQLLDNCVWTVVGPDRIVAELHRLGISGADRASVAAAVDWLRGCGYLGCAWHLSRGPAYVPAGGR